MRGREDSRADDAEAARRLPGPDYYQVLEWIHAALRPAVYLEIGVLYGESLKLALPPGRAIGVDPEPLADHAWRAPTEILRMTSDEYFATQAVPQIGLAFLDGSHRFEDVWRDFGNVERHAAPGCVVLVHDTIPLDERTAAPERTTEFHTGDVWKMLAYLARRRPELEVATVPAAPSGLTMVRGLDPRRGAEDARGIAEIAGLGWARRGEYLVTIPNRREAVERWLGAGRRVSGKVF